MTSRYETEIDPNDKPTQHAQEQQLPASSESSETAYDRLTAYGFVRRYVGGKIVADIGREGIGYGTRLLAENAESVTGLSDLSEALDLASAVYSAPNVSYRAVELPELPHSENHFDVVVAFGMIESVERPEDFVRALRRVLKEDGVLLISAMDKQTNTNERSDGAGAEGCREMYVGEFRQLLERHFGQVKIYRQGAVAGGFIFPDSEQISGAAALESARFSPTDPRFGVESPVTRSVIAVCGDGVEAFGQEEEGRPYLLLDRERRVFEESEERAEDVELMREEIHQMQETEVQAFLDTIKARHRLIEELPRYLPLLRNLVLEELRYRGNIVLGNVYAIRRKGPRGMAKGASRRLSALHRRLREGQKPQ